MMKHLIVIAVLSLVLITDLVVGDCDDCKEEENKFCFHKECKCIPGYFYYESTGQCLELCEKRLKTYVEYPKAMIDQGLSYKEINLEDADDDIDACEASCNQRVCACVGFTVKRNEVTNRGKCFLNSSTPFEVFKHWRERKGRWSYYQKKCE